LLAAAFHSVGWPYSDQGVRIYSLKKAHMTRAFAMQGMAALALSGCLSVGEEARLERASLISLSTLDAPTHPTPAVSQAPECQTTYDCCLKRHPGDPEACAVSPTLSPPGTGSEKAKRPVNLNRCLDSCAAGGQVLIQFCNDIADSEIRAVCFSKTHESETSCRNFCFNYFGK
jgi:hypothetical protein